MQGILQPGRSGGRVTEVGAVHDALEALNAIAATSEEGRLVCLQSGGTAAAATALQVTLPAVQTRQLLQWLLHSAAKQPVTPTAASVVQDAVTHHELAPLAVGFIGALLQGSSRFTLLSGEDVRGDPGTMWCC